MLYNNNNNINITITPVCQTLLYNILYYTTVNCVVPSNDGLVMLLIYYIPTVYGIGVICNILKSGCDLCRKKYTSVGYKTDEVKILCTRFRCIMSDV